MKRHATETGTRASARALLTAGAALIALSPAGVIPARAASDILSVPAINKKVINPEAIRKSETAYGDWIARCEEVVDLGKNVCNLVTRLKDAEGAVRGVALVTTDKKGELGVMVRLLLPVAVGAPLVVDATFSAAAKGQKPVPVKYHKETYAVGCTDTCGFVFPADPQLLYLLNEGGKAQLAFSAPAGGPDWRGSWTRRPLTLTLSGAGFSESVKATLKKN